MNLLKKYWSELAIILWAFIPFVLPIDDKAYAAILVLLGAYGIYAKATKEE